MYTLQIINVDLDLLAVGIATAAISIMGFIVFLANSRSRTNRTFLGFALIAIFWSITTYLIFQATNPLFFIWILRISIFFAVWYCFFLFRLFYIFPQTEINLPRWYYIFLIPVAIVTSLLTLSQLVFLRVEDFYGSLRVVNGPVIPLFGVVVVGFIVFGIFFFIKKMIRTSATERQPFKFLLSGLSITFILHIIFNFILPAFFNNSKFVPLGAVFTFPFIAFTGYAIIRHRLLNIKVIGTEVFVLSLLLISLVQLAQAEDITQRLVQGGVFLSLVIVSIVLIKSVLTEVEQKERLQVLTKELEEKNVKLADLDKLKTEFLAFAAHQLKSPLSAIKGFASMIGDGTFGKVEGQVPDVTKKITDSVNRLLALINNFLDLGKIESGKMEFQYSDVDFGKLVENVFEEHKFLAADKKPAPLTYTLENGLTSPVILKADEQKLRQVLQNFIDNSIKYTPAGFTKVIVKDEGESVLFSVTDSGIGIAKELLPKLFQKFSRVTGEQDTKKIQGTGLGLYIAKVVVDAHNGKMWAESPGEGKGSTFNLRLSKTPPSPPPQSQKKII